LVEEKQGREKERREKEGRESNFLVFGMKRNREERLKNSGTLFYFSWQ